MCVRRIRLSAAMLLSVLVTACGGSKKNDDSAPPPNPGPTPIAPVSMGAWIGATNSQVTFPSSANGMRFTRTRDRSCNLVNYASCAGGQSNQLTGVVVSDTAATTAITGYYWLESGSRTSAPLAVGINRFSERIGHTALFFNNRYWVFGGGFDNSNFARSDYWSSVDGKSWELENSNAPFGTRWLHQSVVFDNKMWVIGGLSGAPTTGAILNNVWSTTDGANWTLVPQTAGLPTISPVFVRVAVHNNAMWAVAAGNVYSSTDGANWQLQSTAPFGGSFRQYASLTAYSGRLWYIGGNVSGNTLNDVWSSTNGVNWTLVTPSAAFASRMQHTSFVLNNRLWVFGGRNSVANVLTRSDDAWSTADGISWTPEALSNEVDQSFFSTVVQESGKVTLIGGVLRGYSNKVLQTTDGNNWAELSTSAQFGPRILMAPVSFQGDLWTIGGATLQDVANNEIWRSSDNGLNWTRVATSGPLFSARTGHGTLVYNNRMWVIGGWDNVLDVGGTEVRLNDVWSSADGITWRLDTAHAAFSPRQAHAAVVFNGQMFVTGGNTDSTTNAGDVWSSADGVTWAQQTGSAAFGARSAHAVVAHNGALWLTGGSNGGSTLADVWTSLDGINWNSVSIVGASFAARSYHGSVVYNNRIWVVAGTNGGPYPTGANPASPNSGNVWSSANGVNWTLHTANAPFGPRYLHGLVVHNNELVFMGGQDLIRHNDVWRSTDGVNWRAAFNGVIQFP